MWMVGAVLKGGVYAGGLKPLIILHSMLGLRLTLPFVEGD